MSAFVCESAGSSGNTDFEPEVVLASRYSAAHTPWPLPPNHSDIWRQRRTEHDTGAVYVLRPYARQK